MMVFFVFLPDACPKILAQPEKPQETLSQKAGQEGFRLNAILTVRDHVGVEAVLLPPQIVQQLFGKEVSRTYAAIHLTISNRNSDAAFIVHSVHLDFSQWLLNHLDSETGQQSGETGTKPVDVREWQTQAGKYHISSVESKIVRGQMLQAKTWTVRNIAVRALRLLGSLTAAYQFKIHDEDWIRGISVFNGNVIPALEGFWPDVSVDRLNRLNDMGFRVNTFVPKESSVIMLAFFPLDRFISPTMKKLYLKYPAMFFSPMAFICDSAMRDQLARAFRGTTFEGIFKPPIDVDSLTKNDSALNALRRLSMDSVRIVVGGVMAVNVEDVPGRIENIVVGDRNDNAENWATEGEKRAILYGRYFTGGEPHFDIRSDSGISQPEVIPDGSTDSVLRIRYKISKEVPPGTHIFVRVRKSSREKSSLDSEQYDLVANYTPCVPNLSKARYDENSKTLFLDGSCFYETAGNPLSIVLHDIGKDPETIKDKSLLSPNQIAVSIKAYPIINGTTAVSVKKGSFESGPIAVYATSSVPPK